VYNGNTGFNPQMFCDVFPVIVEHHIGRTQQMRAKSIVSEIKVFVIGIRIVRNTLSYPELQFPFEKIKIIVCIQPKVVAQGTVVEILIDKRKARIRIIVCALPLLMAIGLFVDCQDQSRGMFADQMGNIRIMKYN